MSTSATPPEEKAAKGKGKAMLILPLAVVVILLALMGYSLQTGDPHNLPSALIGKPVPEFALTPIPRLENDMGTPTPGFSSSVFKKGKVAILNVWASWCAPCAVEHPELVALARKGIPLYGINYKGDTPDAARRFLARLGNPFLAVGMDTTGMTGIDFGVYGVPETFVIDGTGHIVLRHPGPLTAEVIADKIMPAIRKAEKDGAAARS
jgi:cytochrome c biogenesis protein CcmG, thiol:disulfide interchange protein DsbE